MKILVLAPQPFFQNRGTPIAVKMLVEELQVAGHRIDLLVFPEGEDVDLGNINLIRVKSFPFISGIGPGFSFKKILCDFLMMVKASFLCKSNKYDVIHAVEEAVFIAILLKFIYKIPYIYDIDSWLSDQLIDKYSFLRFLRPIFNYFEETAVHRCLGAVAVCEALEQKVQHIDPDKPLLRLEDVSLLNSDCTYYESLAKTINSQDEIVLYVGNLEKYQGIDLLLNAFALVFNSHSTSQLVIIGGTDKDRKKYKTLSENLCIATRVHFLGPRSIEYLGMYLQQADILVSPRFEGENTPMKIYSYMASEVPIVATRINSHTQVLNDSNSFLAEPNHNDFSQALMGGLTQKDKGVELAQLAKQTVDNNYSRSAFHKKLNDFYIDLSYVRNMRV
ncbi:MAG: glycosyltransferase family 4 protein [Bacteroidetes bacterium]|nr:glycosyltransferase family 4 protein [Bacteroidota bacterium]